jgi:RimJ/RimL family protein N-acetyltransferase
VTSSVEVLSTPRLLLRNIGDRGVRTVADAAAYILSGPVASYEKFGFGLYAVDLKESGAQIGICGLFKRETLDDVDMGFAFLRKFWGQGYAYESAAAVMDYGWTQVGLNRIVAITAPENHASIELLEKIGLRFEKMMQMPGHEGESKLLASEK